jgi:hypothetical protein
VFEAIFVAVGEELIPVVSVILFVAFGKVHDIQNLAPQVEFQLLEFNVEFATGFVLNVVIELIALDHFLFILDDNLIKNSLDVLLFFLSFFRRVFRLCWSFVSFRFGLDWLIGIKEGEYFRHIINVDSSK